MRRADFHHWLSRAKDLTVERQLLWPVGMMGMGGLGEACEGLGPAVAVAIEGEDLGVL